VIVPAYNEERYLPGTLESIQHARAFLRARSGTAVEILVVDNASTDATAKVAARCGARVIEEPQAGVARARNAGGRGAGGDILVFVDADTLVPPSALARIQDELADARCIGGAVDTRYRPRRRVMRVYLAFWRVLGKLARTAQGATQFCRRDAFEALGGYDDGLFMGEDVDFFWRLGRLARRQGQRVAFIRDILVEPSARRFDLWPVWRILLWTNPAFILLFRRRRATWSGWHASAVR
jgi:glycosyltransferase involved in cell wall biosynthesis